MTIFDDDASFGHSYNDPRRPSSYRVEPEIFDVETPRKQQKPGPAFVKPGSLSMGKNATPPLSS